MHYYNISRHPLSMTQHIGLGISGIFFKNWIVGMFFTNEL